LTSKGQPSKNRRVLPGGGQPHRPGDVARARAAQWSRLVSDAERDTDTNVFVSVEFYGLVGLETAVHSAIPRKTREFAAARRVRCEEERSLLNLFAAVDTALLLVQPL